MAIFTILNTTGIAIPDDPAVNQTVNVFGLQGAITDVSVAINDLTHTFPADLDMLLVGANGTSNLEFWSDIGPNDDFPGGNDLTNADFVISDSGATVLPDTSGVPVSGTTYQPADYEVAEIDASFGLSIGPLNHPATNGTATFGAAFDGLSGTGMNGAWTLYVDDDAGIDIGTIGSWGVTIVTDNNAVAVTGTGGTDALVLTITGVGTATYSLNGGPAIAVSGMTSFSFDGLGGSDTFTVNGPNSATTWDIGTNSVAAGVNHSNVETINLNGGSQVDTFNINAAPSALVNINAGAGNDSFNFANGASLTPGSFINGGGDTDTLNYAAYTTAVRANLGLTTTGLSGTLEADQETPGTTSSASGTVTISNYSPLLRTFDIAVTVTGIAKAEVNNLQIHRQGVGVDGPGITDFLIDDIIGTGNGFIFNATGVSLAALDEAAFLGGFTYFNVQTDAFPDGAIRGQLFSNGNVIGGSGTATGVSAISNVENVIGGSGADSIVGSFAVNTLRGGGGDDTILGGPGDDTLQGEANNDVLLVNNGDATGTETIDGGSGSDRVQVNGSPTGNDVFIVGANGSRVDFDSIEAGAEFSLDIGTVETLSVVGRGGGDGLNVGNLAGVADLSTISLHGLDGDDGLRGGAFGETLRGHGGADQFEGKGGADTLEGGAGDDGFGYNVPSEAATGEIIRGGAGVDAIRLFQAQTYNFTGVTITSVEALHYDDQFIGAATAILRGTQIGGIGKINTVSGFDQNINKLIVNAASDVNLSGVTFTNWVNGTDTITINGSASGESLTGSSQNDIINGNGGGDTINGGAGSDTMNGGAGVDTMRGGVENDTYVVDSTGDKAIESAGQGTDLVKAGASFTLGAEVENLTLTGSGAVNGTGNTLANVIAGNGGANRINGGIGLDTLTGGAGPDTFVFDVAVSSAVVALDNADTIADFNPTDDTIELLASVFPKLKVGVLKNKAFDSGKKKPSKDKHAVYYDEKNGGLWYDANGKKKGGKGDVLIATLDPGLDLSAGDIVVA